MKLPFFADPKNLVQPEDPEPPLPEGIGALQLLQKVYRGEVKASPQQMRAAIECLPFEEPKLSAMAVTAMDPNSFARALDRAIECSNGARLIEGHAIRDE